MKHNESDENLAFESQKIVGVNMEKEIKRAFLAYSMSVIVSRALPDVRDGMKPGGRRILYAMYEDNLTYDKPFRKSATTVGNVLGHYHPHGDAAVYQTMVRMAQPFSMRYPLVEGHGNFGNVDGDGAAAYRYTEARLARLSDQMMADIEKEVVDFMPNFDNKLREPTVLPSRFPNLLINGSIGIAVGMATYIPPHNMREVIDGTVYLIDHPDCEVKDLMQFIKGPDFPTRATICGTQGIYDAYTTGRGKIVVRARCTVEEEHHRIIVTEIPYQVNKSQLVEAIANLHKDKKIDGITGLRDESGRGGMRIVIEYRRDVNGQVILNQLYKYSQLQDTCAVNMLALVGNEPKILNLKQVLDEYVKFQLSVVTRRTQFDLDKALREMHIYEGYKIAIDNIDEVIKIIRGSESVAAAKEALMARFALSEAQAQAIVDMTLGKLSGMERAKIEERLAKLEAIVADLTAILADGEKIKGVLKDEMIAIRDKFGDERRTELLPLENEIDLEDLIEKHTCIITATRAGYVKRMPAATYAAQRRGGRGIIGMSTKEEDLVESVIAANSHDYIMLFTNTGRVYTQKVYQIPEASRTAKGTNVVNLLSLAEGEKVTAVITVEGYSDEEYLTMVTKRGVIKRTLLSEFEYQRKSGKIALSLDEGDELMFVRRTDGQRSLIIATSAGLAVRFDEQNVRCMGRLARGVRGMRIADDDEVCGVTLAEEGKKLITVTEKGFGKRTDFDDFREMAHRGGKGVFCQKVSDKTGRVTSIASVSEDEDLMIITNEGVIIRTPVAGIPVYSRSAGGVIIMRLAEGVSIVGFTHVEHEDEEETAEAPVEGGDIVEATAVDVTDATAETPTETPTEEKTDEEI